MVNLLSRLPEVQYNGYLSANIISRIAVVKDHLKKYEVYHKYVIKDGERPDSIAFDYYDDSNYAWLVLLPNNIYDIYNEWPLTNEEFKDYMMAKYGKLHETMNIVSHYVYTGIGGNIETENEIRRHSWKMSPETFNLMTAEEKSGWSPVMLYDYELSLNEDKRQIRLISNIYLRQIENELGTIL